MKKIKRLIKFYLSEKKKSVADVDIINTLSSHKNMSSKEIFDGFQVINHLSQSIETLPRDERVDGKLSYFELKFEDCFPMPIIEREYTTRRLKPVGFNTLMAIEASWVEEVLTKHAMLGTTFRYNGELCFFFLNKDGKVAVPSDGIIPNDIIFFGLSI